MHEHILSCLNIEVRLHLDYAESLDLSSLQICPTTNAPLLES